jgi:hypothetical protein
MRITDKDLQAVVDRINRMTKSPMTPYVKRENGSYEAQIANYHLSHAYGGVCLHRMHNESGGVSSPLSCGHIPKRDLYERMHAFVKGLEYPS